MMNNCNDHWSRNQTILIFGVFWLAFRFSSIQEDPSKKTFLSLFSRGKQSFFNQNSVFVSSVVNDRNRQNSIEKNKRVLFFVHQKKKSPGTKWDELNWEQSTVRVMAGEQPFNDSLTTVRPSGQLLVKKEEEEESFYRDENLVVVAAVVAWNWLDKWASTLGFLRFEVFFCQFKVGKTNDKKSEKKQKTTGPNCWHRGDEACPMWTDPLRSCWNSRSCFRFLS